MSKLARRSVLLARRSVLLARRLGANSGILGGSSPSVVASIICPATMTSLDSAGQPLVNRARSQTDPRQTPGNIADIAVRNVAVLGATGSVGTATAEVISHLDRVDPQSRWRVWAASGH